MNSQKSLFSVAILAGGLATRLRPLTQTIPKSLVDVNGEPFIAHQLRLLRSRGVREVVICSGYLGEMIQEYVGDGSRFNMKALVSSDGQQLLGTAGALKKALPLLGDTFFVLYGDSYLTCDFVQVQEAYERSRKSALMTVFKNDGQWEKSNVEFNNGEIVLYDKKLHNARMRHVDYGLGIFQSRCFDVVESDKKHDLAEVYQERLKHGELAAVEVFERFYEIGSFEGLEETRKILAQKKLGDTHH